MLVMLDVVLTRHYEDARAEADHLDGRLIERGEHRRGDDLVDRPECGVPAREIEHAIDRTEQRVELMRAEQHGDTKLPLQGFRQADDGVLVMRIETDERLV